MSATVRDIAKVAGVSIGTVSRALKNQAGLTESTRLKIHQVASEMGYNFNKLRNDRIRKVCFIIHRQHNTLASYPFYASVLQGAEHVCHQHELALSFLSLGPADPIQNQIKRHEPDAIICAGFFEPDVLRLIQKLGKPVVLLDNTSDELTHLNPDNRQGAMLATDHLIKLGRRRIAFISGSQAHYSIRERVHGYHKSLFNHQLLADPDLFVTINDALPLDSATEEVTAQLLALPTPPDAIVCYNDAVALAAMRACQQKGYSIPKDIAVIGFDDIDAAQHANPPLSTIRIEKGELGKLGVESLLNLSTDKLSMVLPVSLCIRQSTQPTLFKE
ncbi:LacI family transcriptional regulator [Leeia sp. TBRC 13508]|uniref:LacI family transcriptional regulator n=1 Tax=Leeia speluncae TaxID=2884804 RepID=A0ABS8DAR5_9NEIS|nr:LacI family DNA-binding transcriptional regulator [Leeia speluncae]MCB6185304.1 LacI family transcriptional regulator [Leeia speluncae]